MHMPVLVVRFGSSSLTSNGEIDERVALDIARQTAILQRQYNILIDSSGAVDAWKRHLKNYRNTLVERKAAAAIGYPLLVRNYGQFFNPFNIEIAQSLCERQHFGNRNHFLQL